MTVRFSRTTYDELVAHGQGEAPREVCGVLGGGERDRPDGPGSTPR